MGEDVFSPDSKGRPVGDMSKDVPPAGRGRKPECMGNEDDPTPGRGGKPDG